MQNLAYVSWCLMTETLFDDDGYEYEGKEYVLIDKVYTPLEARGKGYARRALQEELRKIKDLYPTHDIKIVACPLEDMTSMAKLVTFYESLGFTQDDQENSPYVFMTL